MGPGRVYRARFASSTVIVKTSPSPRETIFYESIADLLRQFEIPTPRLAWSTHVDNSYWLFLEDIPDPVPVPHRDDWRPDPRKLAVLCRLHAAALDAPPELSELYSPRWTDEMTEAALSLVPSDAADQFARDLRAIQIEGQRLFESLCWISGDPNPTNWGI